MKKLILPAIAALLSVIIYSCENRDVSYSDGPNFNDIHDGTYDYFDSVVVDGCVYLILERDRNNPHEGFGFMALKGNDIKKNQDSIKAMLKTIMQVQVVQMAKQNNSSEKEAQTYVDELFKTNHKRSLSPIYKKIEPSE